MLFIALAFVLATSGPVTLLYIVAPAFFTGIVVGSQYPQAALLIGPYGIAALLNAFLSLWIAHFIGRGEMRFGVVLAAGVAVEIALIIATPHDALTLVLVVLGVAAVAMYVWERRRRVAHVAA